MRNDAFDILTIYNPDTEPFQIVYGKEIHKTIQPKKAVRVIKMIGELALKHLVDRMCQKQNKSINDQTARDLWTKVILIDVESNSAPVPQTLEDQARAMTDKLNNSSDLERFLNSKNVVLPPIPADGVVPATPAPVVPTPTADNNWKFDPLTGKPITPTITPESVAITPEMIDPSKIEIQAGDTNPVAAGAMASLAQTPTIPPDPAVASIIDRERGEAMVLPEQTIDDTPPIEFPVNAAPTRQQLLDFAQNTLLMDLNDPKTKAELDKMTDQELANTLKYDQTA